MSDTIMERTPTEIDIFVKEWDLSIQSHPTLLTKTEIWPRRAIYISTSALISQHVCVNMWLWCSEWFGLDPDDICIVVHFQRYQFLKVQTLHMHHSIQISKSNILKHNTWMSVEWGSEISWFMFLCYDNCLPASCTIILLSPSAWVNRLGQN